MTDPMGRAYRRGAMNRVFGNPFPCRAWRLYSIVACSNAQGSDPSIAVAPEDLSLRDGTDVAGYLRDLIVFQVIDSLCVRDART